MEKIGIGSVFGMVLLLQTGCSSPELASDYQAARWNVRSRYYTSPEAPNSVVQVWEATSASAVYPAQIAPEAPAQPMIPQPLTVYQPQVIPKPQAKNPAPTRSLPAERLLELLLIQPEKTEAERLQERFDAEELRLRNEKRQRILTKPIHPEVAQ